MKAAGLLGTSQLLPVGEAMANAIAGTKIASLRISLSFLGVNTMKQILLFTLVSLVAFAPVAISDQSASKTKEIEISGEVVSVNTASNEILIRVIEKGKAKNILFAVTEESVLSDSDQNTLELEEIEQGSQVTVRYSKSRLKLKKRLNSLQVGPMSG